MRLKIWILTFLFLIFHTVQFIDPGPVVRRISSERNLKGCQKLVHSREQGLWPGIFQHKEELETVVHCLRCSGGSHGRLTLEYDDAVSQVCGHNEVVFDDEGRLLSVEDVPARRTNVRRQTIDDFVVRLNTS